FSVVSEHGRSTASCWEGCRKQHRAGARQAPTRCRGGHQVLPAFFACACAASHSALVSSRKPAPLQAFWPLQEFLADLRADWPLQAFTPSHFTLPSSAAAALKDTVANITAAAAASARVEVLRALIRHLLGREQAGSCGMESTASAACAGRPSRRGSCGPH